MCIRDSNRIDHHWSVLQNETWTGNQIRIDGRNRIDVYKRQDMISVMEGDKQVAGIPVKIVKSTMSKIQSKQDDVDIVILEDLSEITKML